MCSKGTNLKEELSMGMAASQARLLTLTARIHDVEYMAQSIQNAKLALATQEDQVYQEYLAALDESTLTVKNYKGEPVSATFDTLCGINAVRASKNERYVLRNDKNQIIVKDDIARGYENFKKTAATQDAYNFAMYMLSGEDPNFDIKTGDDGKTYPRYADAENRVFEEKCKENKLSENIKTYKQAIEDNMMQICEIAAETDAGALKNSVENNINTLGLKAAIDELRASVYSSFIDRSDSKEDDAVNGELRTRQKKVKELMQTIDSDYEKLQYNLYTSFSEEIFTTAGNHEDDFNEDQFWYFVNMYKQLEANGDNCIAISEYNGFAGSASSDQEWLQEMIRAGKITIDISTMDRKTGKMSFASTGVASDTYLEYTTTSTIDKARLAKAEAEYEHKLKQIDQKDKKFDMDLSKLETERTALTKEYDSVKKVISENIERSFGIFS